MGVLPMRSRISSTTRRDVVEVSAVFIRLSCQLLRNPPQRSERARPRRTHSGPGKPEAPGRPYRLSREKDKKLLGWNEEVTNSEMTNRVDLRSYSASSRHSNFILLPQRPVLHH